MTDLEKVKQGLDSELEEGGSCAACPYKGQAGLERCYIKLLIDARKVIREKEQDAVKPKSKTRHREYPQVVHRCGNCNEILYRYYKFCPTCGKGVKWE